jgi:hypothetical protein
LRVPGAVDFDDQPRHPRQVTRTLLDELHTGQLRQGDRIRDRYLGARPGIEIERQRQLGLTTDRIEIAQKIALRRRTGERPQRR